jgi:hypothetical protein
VSVKLGLDYQKDDTTTSINYERIQSTNNKAHSYSIEGFRDDGVWRAGFFGLLYKNRLFSFKNICKNTFRLIG